MTKVQDAWEVITQVSTGITSSILVQKIAIAIIVFVIGVIAAKIGRSVVHRILNELHLDSTQKKLIGIPFSVEGFLSRSVAVVIYIVTAFLILETLGITSYILYLLAGLLFILVLVSLFLVVKDLVPNWVAGLVIKAEKRFTVGQKIKIHEIQGIVTEITPFDTHIKAGSDTILVPNTVLIKNSVYVHTEKETANKESK